MVKCLAGYRRTLPVVIGLCFAGLGSYSHAANLMTNPSFELGTFTNRGDGFQILPLGSTAIGGWTVINDSLAWGTVPNSAASVNPITPFDGTFFLDLQGDGIFGAPYGGVMQTLPTVSGQRYHFAFDLGTEQSPASPATHGPISVVATAGSTSLPFTFNPGGTGTQWGQFGFDFTASSSSTPISIVGTDTAGGAYIGLDLVSVTFVPEPSTLLIASLGSIALIAGTSRMHSRRRVQTNSSLLKLNRWKDSTTAAGRPPVTKGSASPHRPNRRIDSCPRPIAVNT